MRDVIRIAMWSGPRNISTALMRSFENRPDTMVVDEPFYACFLQETGIDHPGRQLVLKAQSTVWQQVANDLTAAVPDGYDVFYQKHMCHHMVGSLDWAWARTLKHAFLIRDPRAMLASYVKSRAEVTLDDIGLARQVEIFEREADRLGSAPPVIEGSDILRDPEFYLGRLCAALGIAFDQAMLSWPSGARDTDGVWAPWWYENVQKSTGFMKREESEEVHLNAALERIAEQALPLYERMRAHKIT
ncbi:HAD family hydrolase [Kordiimonas sp.]|uniref:sulfotransferase-like domain-containing protein n=1 Tax=Kordiimonas sp. TaxID=1970157 RepID=UPI003A91D498